MAENSFEVIDFTEITRLRKDLGMFRKDFCEKVGITPGRLSQMEKAAREGKPVRVLESTGKKMARVLKVKREFLFRVVV